MSPHTQLVQSLKSDGSGSLVCTNTLCTVGDASFSCSLLLSLCLPPPLPLSPCLYRCNSWHCNRSHSVCHSGDDGSGGGGLLQLPPHQRCEWREACLLGREISITTERNIVTLYFLFQLTFHLYMYCTCRLRGSQMELSQS